MNNENLSRLGMWNAKKYPGCLAPEQCGSRSDHHAKNETSLNSTLICDEVLQIPMQSHVNLFQHLMSRDASIGHLVPSVTIFVCNN
jgi:positive regulator of sigma E activity